MGSGEGDRGTLTVAGNGQRARSGQENVARLDGRSIGRATLLASLALPLDPAHGIGRGITSQGCSDSISRPDVEERVRLIEWLDLTRVDLSEGRNVRIPRYARNDRPALE
jgi:hypothetical protein